jgi:hypothetical protein
MDVDSRYQPPSAVVADVAQEELPTGTLNPWFSMWTRPRATIRQIVAADPRRFVILLAILIGITQVLDRASSRALGDRLSLTAILATAVVVGPISGIIVVYLYGWLVHLTGRALAGTGSRPDIRAAIAWGNVPALWAALSWIPAIAILQIEMFTTETPRIESSSFHLLVLIGVVVAQVVGAIWTLFAMCKALGQVQGFSAWKALGNVVLALLALVLPVGIVIFAMFAAR